MHQKIKNIIQKVSDVRAKIIRKNPEDPHASELSSVIDSLSTLHLYFSSNVELYQEIKKIQLEQKAILKDFEYVFHPDRIELESIEILEYDLLIENMAGHGLL